jgi:hypothetical protein
LETSTYKRLSGLVGLLKRVVKWNE